MTDRHAAYIVVLDHDIRDDDSEGILDAIRHIRFVASVEPVISSLELAIARSSRDSEWRDALGKLAMNGPGKQDKR